MKSKEELMSDICWANDWDYVREEEVISVPRENLPPEREEESPLVNVKRVVIEPLCSLEADKTFECLYLNKSNVKLRLTESTLVLTPEGEAKFLFLKNVIPGAVVAPAWKTLQMLRFRPSKDSRRKALRGSGGGELLLGWIEFPRRGGGYEPILTADTKSQDRKSVV